MPDSGDEESIDYDGYVSEGIGLAHYLERSDDEVTAALEASGHLEPGEQLASEFKAVSEFKDNGWNMADRTPYLLKDFNSQAPFGTALKSLGVSDKARPEGKHEYTEYEHTLPYMLDGVEEKVSHCTRELMEALQLHTDHFLRSPLANWRNLGSLPIRKMRA